MSGQTPMVSPNQKVLRACVERDPNYRPYCLACTTMQRMRPTGPLCWTCVICGAVCDVSHVKEW